MFASWCHAHWWMPLNKINLDCFFLFKFVKDEKLYEGKRCVPGVGWTGKERIGSIRRLDASKIIFFRLVALVLWQRSDLRDTYAVFWMITSSLHIEPHLYIAYLHYDCSLKLWFILVICGWHYKPNKYIKSTETSFLLTESLRGNYKNCSTICVVVVVRIHLKS